VDTALTTLLPTPTRDQIQRLQEAMTPLQVPLPDPVHHFAPGIYLRELTVPAGMLIVGKRHKTDHFIIVTKGKAEVISEFGRDIVQAGFLALSKAGIKRVALALEDTTFITIHANESDTQDIDLIETKCVEEEIISALSHNNTDTKEII
jgi:hypothetical protein